MNIEELTKKIIAEKQAKLKEVAEDIKRDTKEAAPKITGNLANSHTVEVINPDEIVVKATADYATEVHENPESRGYKWFERTVLQNKEKYLRKLRGE